MERFEGRVAVVTGAASGIGRALAGRWADEGMKVVLADVEQAALDRAAAELAGAGAEVLAVRTDVSDSEAVDALARAAVDAFGAVHLLCNNAGVAAGGPLHDVPLDDWRWVLGVNLWGVVHGIRSFLPILAEQDEAHIVNTASVAGHLTAPFMAPYNASKFAVVAVSETLFKELAMAGSSVGVSVLCPGWVNTRIGESDRNRPGGAVEAGDDSAAPGPLRAALQHFLATGMDPADVAAAVAGAVRTRRFYVFTHPEMKEGIRHRAEDVLEERNPGFAMPF